MYSRSPTVVDMVFNMRTAADVERALRAACLAGFFAAILQVLTALWYVLGGRATVVEAVMLFSAMIMFGMVFGMTRYSRLSAVGMVAVYGGVQVYQWIGVLSPISVISGIFSLIFVFVFVRGVQATFAFHKLERQFGSWQRTMDSSLDPRLFDD